MALIQSQISAGGVAAGVVMDGGGVSHAARRRSAAWTRNSAATPLSGGDSHAECTMMMAVSHGMVRGAPAPTSSALSRGTLKMMESTQRHVLTSQTRNLQSTKHAKNISKRTLTFMTHTFVTPQSRPVSNPT